MAVSDVYDQPIVSAPVTSTDALARITGMGVGYRAPEYRVQMYRANLDGSLAGDLSPSLIKDTNGRVDWDSTAPVPGSLHATLDAGESIAWGSDIVAAFQLIRNRDYNQAAGYDLATWHQFPVNHFVLTSPGFADLDSPDARMVTGFDKNYLLQNQPSDTISWDGGTTYKTLVQAVFLAAGLITSALSEVCDYPGDWAVKTLPDPISYPMDGSTTYLDIINEQLKASGCAPIYAQPNGRWQVTTRLDPTTQSLRWRWAGSDAPGVLTAQLDDKVVLRHATEYDGDVWNVPNQWVFIQQGLTFDPVEGSGQYTVNNTTLAPSDQITVGRVVRSTQFLQASGQADLQTQGDAIVTEAISRAEKLVFQTRAWPIAGQADVFLFSHADLPGTPTRRVQAAQWELDLWGGPMRWTTYAVAAL